MARSLDELTNVPDPAWPELSAGFAEASVPVQVLPVDPAAGGQVLYRLQMTAHSAMGALALHTGGLLVDHGWLRILGGGSPGMPDLATANGVGDPADGAGMPRALFVAVDVLGGRFAVDGGGLGIAMGKVCYFGPDTLGWQSLGIGHHAFVARMTAGAVSDFYADLRWPGWEQEVQAVNVDQGLSLYPPPFTTEGKDLARVSRRAVPIRELFGFYDDAARQLGPPPD